jgi:phosphopantothenoylcysteine decarboxylase / phosphopantothenate---cysteine ligase
VTAGTSGVRRVRVVLGVPAGIAAYKVCELLRLITEEGHRVRVVPTRASLEFVGTATWAALSGEPVTTDMWSGVQEVPHVRIGQEADLVVVAPATADFLAKAAHGLADDLLTAVLLTAGCPVVMAPAMHTEMWQHPATRENVATLRRRGVIVVEPAKGRLTGADSGSGRLPEPAELWQTARAVLARGSAGATDLAGRRIVITAGGTREALDPVRYFGNRSSGRQGYALARTAVARGAEVTVVSANVGLPDPTGARMIRVTSAEELRLATVAAVQEAPQVDAVVMAAAVADFRPARVSDTKLKKSHSGDAPPAVILTRTRDVLAELVAGRSGNRPIIVGFAAETGDTDGGPLALAAAKLRRKGCDLLVVNEVGADRGFESANNAATILAVDNEPVSVSLGPKERLADVIWDLVCTRLTGSSLPG